MRRKPNNELKEYLIKTGKNYTIKQLLKKVNKKFNETYEENELRKYLVRNKITYKYEMEKKVRKMGTNVPLLTEYVRPDGMTMIKIGRNEWEYKQRYLYEKYHNVKLKSNEYIIFLDQDRTNFDINNLKKLNARQSGTYANIKRNHRITFNDAKYTELELALVDLVIGIKDKEKELCEN